MDFQIRGLRYRITDQDVLSATRNVPPNPGDGRNKYFVELHERHYPIKQVIRLVSGLPPLGFTAQDAHRILSRLGFGISERSAGKPSAANAGPGRANRGRAGAPAVTPAGDAVDDGGDVLRLLLVFETDEDGWEVVSCPTLPGCHSQGRTRTEALANIREAIGGYLASMREHGAPPPASSEFQVVEVRV